MRFSRHNAQPPPPRASRHVARRIVVAVMLALALLAGSAPTGSLSFADAPQCSMSCCAGLPPHPPGECASVVSCHVKLPKHTPARDDAAPTHQAGHVPDPAAASSHKDDGEHSDHGDDDNNAAAVHHHAAETQTTTHHASHSAPQAETHQAQTRTTPHSSATHVSPPSRSSQESSQQPPQPGAKQEARGSRSHPSLARLSLANPCPPDCGMAASSFTNAPRSRDAATLAGTHRPRPPTFVLVRTHASGLPLDFSTGKYRLAPPRAPPLVTPLNSTPD